MREFKMWKNIDYGLILTVLIICAFGILMIASATNAHEVGLTRQVKIQSFAFVLGVVVIIAFMFIDYNMLGDLYKVIYVASILVLLMVYIPGLGVVQGNARSWIKLGPIFVQTSEVAKLGFILSFAKFLETRKGKLKTIKDVIPPLLFVAPFILLIMKQPDFGSALVYISITIGMLFVAELDFKLILLGLVIVVVGALNANLFLSDTQYARIESFLNPDSVEIEANYHLYQSKVTLGSGMETGRGVFKGIYHRLDYLPIQETDFIYAVIGEETGFVGGVFVISMYFLMMASMLKVAFKSKDTYGSLIVTGVIFMFLFQIFENIGMTMGLMPITGITLPFLSYGGSSLIISLTAVGFVLNVYFRRKRRGFMI